MKEPWIYERIKKKYKIQIMLHEALKVLLYSILIWLKSQLFSNQQGWNNVAIKINCTNCMFSIDKIIPSYCNWRFICTITVSVTSVYIKLICKFLPRTGKNNMIVADVMRFVTTIYVHTKCFISYFFLM